ncbi:GAF domain-containing protein [Actinomycetes bacterium M1A6_2h]
MSGDWILVETLTGDPADATVIGIGGRDKEWASLPRALPSKSAHTAARSAIASAARSGSDATSPVAGTGDVVVARPVSNTTGTVHGMRLWHGPGDAVPDTWPAAGAFDWSASTRELGLTPGMRALFGLDADRTTFTGPELFRSVAHFDGALDFVSTTLRDGPGLSWVGSLTVASAAGALPVRSAMRSVADPDGPSWRGIMFELNGPLDPPRPSVESVALEALSRASDTAIALVDLEKMRLVRWVTDPVPDIAWKGVRDQRDTPHPDDIDRIVESVRTFYRGATESALPAVRLRRLDGGWTVVDARATLFPVADGPKLLLAELRTVGHTDEPDPVPPTDTGYPT